MKKLLFPLFILTIPILLALAWFHNSGKAQQTELRSPPPVGESRAVLGAQIGHSLFVEAVAISADGKYLVTGSWDQSARLWEIKTGNEVRQFLGESGFVFSVAITPDNRNVITGSADGSVDVWDAATGETIRPFVGHSYLVSSVRFSTDGKYALTSSWDKTARLWEIQTGKQLQMFGEHPEAVQDAVLSSDGKYVATACHDGTARLWEVATGELVQTFKGHSNWVRSIGFSHDNTRVVTGGEDQTARVWNATSGEEICRYRGHSDAVNAIAVLPGDKYVLSGGFDKSQRIWDLDKCEKVSTFKWEVGKVLGAEISPNGKFVAVSIWPNLVELFDAETGTHVQHFEGRSASVASATFSADDRYILTGCWDGKARLWETATGKQVMQFIGHERQVRAAVISKDNKYVVTGSLDNTWRLWDTVSGKELFKSSGHSDFVNSVAISADNQYVVTGSADKTARLWEVARRRETQRFVGHERAVNSVAISPEGEFVVTGSDDGTTRLWSTATGKETSRLKGLSDPRNAVVLGPKPTETTLAPEPLKANAVVFSSDGKYVLTANDDNAARLWDVATGNQLMKFRGDAQATAISDDGRYVVTGGNDRTASLFEASTGKKLQDFVGHSDKVNSVAFSSDARFVITGGSDSTARIWDATTGKESCTLISFDNDSWAVAAPDGRFDASDLESVKGLHWLMPDDPMTTYPIEIFMRDYYEPRLLARILQGQVFQKLRDISNLNRTQPTVKILDGYRQGKSDLVTITVEVARAQSERQRDNDGSFLTTGVYDLRLFRNGQLVRELSDGPPQNIPPSADERVKLSGWRTESQIELGPSGKRVIRFENIKLPHDRSFDGTEFTAYAFNEDRVKSATTRKRFHLPTDLSPLKRRAYVVMFGVNASEAECMSLNYAVNDVHKLQQTFVNKIKQSGQYEEIVEIPLIADYKFKPDGQRIVSEQSAIKSNLNAVFDLLSGKQIDEGALDKIPNARLITASGPDDLVMVFFSTHGDSDQSGNFYLAPYNIGTTTLCQNTGFSEKDFEQILARFISSEELSVWLRYVDASEMIMIVDACHSAAAVESGGFKPGPMGSRGLGQLAYDKRMKILAATQADNVAEEFKELNQSLLSYILLNEGIEEGLADFKPKDQLVTMTEWLQYAEARVPMWYEDKKKKTESGSQLSPGQRPRMVKRLIHRVGVTQIQTPALFDFARGKRDSILFKKLPAVKP